MGRTPVRVAVISASTIVREGLVSLVGELDDRAVVVDAACFEHPDDHADVVIYDLGAAPGLTGYAELRRLVGLNVPLIALVYDSVASSRCQPIDGHEAAGLISLEVTAAELCDVLELAAHGSQRDPDHPHAPGLPAGLTSREFAVLTLIVAGLSNRQIADRLVVSCNTVKTHIRTAYRKIGARSRVQAVLWAMEHGHVPRPLPGQPPPDGWSDLRGPLSWSSGKGRELPDGTESHTH